MSQHISGKLYAESPIYRGNARKTLFTRDYDGTERLVSLSGEIGGTAQALMDAFIGYSRNRRNQGLINQLWKRLFEENMPDELIKTVSCTLNEACYPKHRLFDIRMGIKLSEDRGAAEAGKNYKMETLFKGSIFDFMMEVNQGIVIKNNNAEKLCCILQELQAGRFWFGAGKSRGLGRCRLELDTKIAPLPKYPQISKRANHLTLRVSFDTQEPILVGWNWGKVDPITTEFAAIEGKFLIAGMRLIPLELRERLSMAMGGPIANIEQWKQKFKQTLPKAIVYWLKSAKGETHKIVYQLTEDSLKKLSKGKFPLSKKIVQALQPIVDQLFESKEDLEKEFIALLGNKEAKKNRRVLDNIKGETQEDAFPEERWQQIVEAFSLQTDQAFKDQVTAHFTDNAQLENILQNAVEPIFYQLNLQIDQQVSLLNSDPWVDAEIAIRKDHLKIKEMLLSGAISESQWGDLKIVPSDISAATWREFLQSHDKIQYSHMLNPRNITKSITNDKTLIRFLTHYRTRAHQELSQAENIDFRLGAGKSQHVSRSYGKPYDTVFMRLLCWSSKEDHGRWEIYIPGSTIKGAFRKRANQLLKALLGESREVDAIIHGLFGAQRQAGMLRFSDAYPTDSAASKKAWCAMDGVKIDPQTGKPADQAKSDYLFAYGSDLKFELRIDVQDIAQGDLPLLNIAIVLINDFQVGDIPLGGNSTNGLGWVKATLDAVEWSSGDKQGITKAIFDHAEIQQSGIWFQITLPSDKAKTWASTFGKIPIANKHDTEIIPLTTTDEGFISHRAFGGYCGTLYIEGEVLTPLHVRESGEPSFTQILQGTQVNGWDTFALSSPDNTLKKQNKEYALPSKTLKGALRTLYTITSDAKKSGHNLGHLNAAEKLFGWVGDGPNQALMGRVSIEFAKFQNPQLSWVQAPIYYGDWVCTNNVWQQIPDHRVKPTLFAGKIRMFPHVSLAPCVEHLSDFTPKSLSHEYLRVVLPGSKCYFALRYWNLEKSELERLIWCLALEKGLAYKLGKLKQLGCGSIRFHVLPSSYYIDWNKRYGEGDTVQKNWKRHITTTNWHNLDVISYHSELKTFLNAESI